MLKEILWQETQNSSSHYQRYRVEKQNLQVERPIGFEHLDKIVVQNSSPTCKHNLFALLQSKKILVRLIAMLESATRPRMFKLHCAHLKKKK